MAEVKTKYDHMTSFGFSFCLYAVVSVAARIVPILVRTLLSLFVHTPSVTELKADGSYLFNVIYPLFGLLMLGSYFAAMYYGFRFAASKVSYRTLKQTSDFRIATELALVLAAGLVFDVYLMFSMELRSEFWYVAALIASFTGVVDKTNLLAIVSERDLQLNYFTLEGLTPHILGAVLRIRNVKIECIEDGLPIFILRFPAAVQHPLKRPVLTPDAIFP